MPWLPTLWLGQYRLWPRPDLSGKNIILNKRKIFGEQQKIFADGNPPEGGLVQQLEGGGGGTPGGQLQLEAGQSALNLPRLQ